MLGENANSSALNWGAVIEVVRRNTLNGFAEAHKLGLAVVGQRATSAC
jgi:hypothetical protein